MTLDGGDGFKYLPGHFDRAAQESLVETVRAGVEAAPLYRPSMPRTGQKLSVRMTNFGPLGWVTDQKDGYRYEPAHPVTGGPWPAMPAVMLDLWRTVTDYPAPPEACLVNFYDPDARMGLHIDWDEEAANAPVVSVSLGDDALFRLGGPQRKGKTRSLRLKSGDVVVLGGASRRFYHGVDRIYPGTSALLPRGGRINLTLRRVTLPD
ncbi:MAG: alpha-ketoglutarate-dependent dioxygenase AlkB [Euryhalocaulis sp.]|uniref:alpha-ketoglutarate-dependent dioxygenase AlkB family protein n=1 Tax=Euryhalocaulis sp. TaxID=2744307 RepID=UPI0017AABD46|nr:alpha-ketoglutarate-dependent dioxygenase AlkB [Euryhalocaulis sp.]MBA4802806.1 alpha-ketoglutarate-dependent dioxygenase AlkB [Euryhalocaulis sp.]